MTFSQWFNQEYLILRYRIGHWMFRWVVDEENDIGLLIFQRLLLVKYKEHTIFRWCSANLEAAPKYIE